MGRDKAAIVVEGRALAERAVAVLTEVFGDVVVVSNATLLHADFGVAVVEDIYPSCGPLGGLHAVLQAAATTEPNRAVFLLACDMPFVTSELVRFLACHQAPAVHDEAWARLPRMNDRVEPLCGLYSTGCLKPIVSALEAGAFKMQEFLNGLTLDAVEITRELPFFDWNLFSNVNRPGDLIKICERVDQIDAPRSATPTEVKA